MPAIDHDKIRELWAKGKNDREVGDAIGVSSSTIFQIRHRLGLASTMTHIDSEGKTDDVNRFMREYTGRAENNR
jgi:hypothetical protein